MSSPFKTKEFLELQARWDKKLEKSGFVDAENRDGSLKETSERKFREAKNVTNVQAKQEYYRAAGFFLYEYRFNTDLERKIWELHIEGLGIREIVKILKKQGHKSIYKDRVHKLLQPLVKECVRGITRT